MSTFSGPLSYNLYDLSTGTFLGHLPLGSVTFGSQLNTPGQFSGQIDIADPRVQALGPIQTTQPARTALMVDYNGAIIWGGIIWPRNYDFSPQTRKLTITATELWSYLQQRVQATDYSSPPYSGLTGLAAKMAIWNASGTDALGVWDPKLIAWQIISDALTQVAYGNILGGLGIAANSYTSTAAYLASGTQTPQGDYISVNYPYPSLQQVATLVGQLMANGLGVGFDGAVDVAYSGAPGSVPVGTVNLSYPRRGRTYAQNGLVLNCGSALSYSPPEDGTQTGNTIYEQGGSSSLVVSQNLTPLQQGYPILEQIKSRANITSANLLPVLTNLGLSDLFIGSYPVVTPSVTMDLFNSSCPLGDFIVGDNARWLVPKDDGAGNVFDPRLPNGLDQEWRITGYNATVADAGMSTLQFNLALPPALTANGPAI